MQSWAVLACGPDAMGLLILGGGALGILTLTVAFLAGFVCLFTSKRKLGLWLTSIPGVILGVGYLLVRSQMH